MEIGKTDRHREHLNASMEWVRSIDHKEWNDPYAVTLNFRNGTPRDIAEKDVTHFLNKLDAWVFKNAYRKYGKEVEAGWCL